MTEASVIDDLAASNASLSFWQQMPLQFTGRRARSGVCRSPLQPGADPSAAGPLGAGLAGLRSALEVSRSSSQPESFFSARWQGEALDGRPDSSPRRAGAGRHHTFCRYAAMVAARGGHVILQVQAPALRLMQSLSAVRGGLVENCAAGANPAELDTKLDLECPLMSLLAVFGTTVETVPWPAHIFLLTGVSRRKEAKIPRSRLEGRHRVGLAWAGNPRYKADRQRSVQLSTLLPLLAHSRHHLDRAAERSGCRTMAALPTDVSVLDGSSQDHDLAETAALMATLDLVITTDTRSPTWPAHGQASWILLPHLSDWRWMQRTETTPWYPTAKLFRQRAPGDWDEVQERVIGKLNELRATERRQPLAS